MLEMYNEWMNECDYLKIMIPTEEQNIAVNVVLLWFAAIGVWLYFSYELCMYDRINVTHFLVFLDIDE